MLNALLIRFLAQCQLNQTKRHAPYGDLRLIMTPPLISDRDPRFLFGALEGDFSWLWVGTDSMVFTAYLWGKND